MVTSEQIINIILREQRTVYQRLLFANNLNLAFMVVWTLTSVKLEFINRKKYTLCRKDNNFSVQHSACYDVTTDRCCNWAKLRGDLPTRRTCRQCTRRKIANFLWISFWTFSVTGWVGFKQNNINLLRPRQLQLSNQKEPETMKPTLK